MHQHHPTPPLRPLTALPFAGLGFDLGLAEDQAGALGLIPKVPPRAYLALAWPAPVARTFGYELLTALGREIRGR
jgi:hypothetical protein